MPKATLRRHRTSGGSRGPLGQEGACAVGRAGEGAADRLEFALALMVKSLGCGEGSRDERQALRRARALFWGETGIRIPLNIL